MLSNQEWKEGKFLLEIYHLFLVGVTHFSQFNLDALQMKQTSRSNQ
jgi:hypothetical protein